MLMSAIVERLDQLQREYDEIKNNLATPFSYEEYQQFRDRRKAILEEARKLIGSLGISEPRWLANS